MRRQTNFTVGSIEFVCLGPINVLWCEPVFPLGQLRPSLYVVFLQENQFRREDLERVKCVYNLFPAEKHAALNSTRSCSEFVRKTTMRLDSGQLTAMQSLDGRRFGMLVCSMACMVLAPAIQHAFWLVTRAWQNTR